MANINQSSPTSATRSATAKKENALVGTLVIVVIAVALLALIGFMFLKPKSEVIEGQVEATSVRISGKLPGRVDTIFVHEGQMVKAGDTLVHISSTVADARLYQAEAMKQAAAAQNRKVDAGTRKQIVESAYQLWQQAQAARDIAETTYQRMEALYVKNVVSAQKRDEAKAAFTAAVAAENAAKAQYNMAREGAQPEDKVSSQAMVNVAQGGVMEVEALLQDQYLTAPADGQIDIIYPTEGELVTLASPIMNLVKMQDKWVTFNVREEMLSELPMGKEITVMVPALDKRNIKVKIFYVRDMGSYAVWRSTKATGEWDSRTFQIKARPVDNIPRLLPGMSVVFMK